LLSVAILIGIILIVIILIVIILTVIVLIVIMPSVVMLIVINLTAIKLIATKVKVMLPLKGPFFAHLLGCIFLHKNPLKIRIVYRYFYRCFYNITHA
jgi:hypothetical protein